MKKIGILLLLSAVFLTTLSAGGTAETKKGVEPLIGISKFLSHPALDAVETGIQDYLESAGKTVRYDFQNANADVSSSAQIAQKFKADKVDIAVGIATPVAQALVNVFTDIPVVFSAVTDPLGAGLVTTYTTPYPENSTGVSDMNPVEAQIELLVRLTGAKTIGNVYASGEANGVTLMEQAKAAAEKLGIGFVAAAVANTAEVKQAAQSIINRVDAIYIATDNTVISALPSVDDVAAKAGVPLMTGDPSNVEGLNFLVAWGFDYYKIGLATGKIIAQLLDGKKPGEIGTVFLTDPEDFELWFNLDMAKKLGITISEELLASAAVLYENDKKIIQ
ncbi:MAG: ABC transporter substrate-binding protein [Sphaerochaetaceae bacterium]|jgi:putative ABC transport system substrate-binding protein|nr:ABC transporter substrate-binding protein [Sphaerochaetaceae bacterium]MDD3366985.1 ABC transporter substrate-binding protein [Sphaerochaetaceae bacterium]MDD4219413.1 ABC transporter substrate-binding protein [Sphaerochaetaceae bacterium]MDY0370753.1 ABC transporter substrate-binding protein [Sphaerochaetaceae bacterium]